MYKYFTEEELECKHCQTKGIDPDVHEEGRCPA